ncbi:hypothetical protein P4H66_28025 [Paenibacillus dokdonensis]|uniref:Uncharacterized protein n=1 Tax=Paenibacillus dokdonensis TaxID=2567944 RepID=A0ABU6GVD2_9BACL|nr:hypothetical protein [Paenibacillus dokdonensis]MEC0243663.1 hypothetical protein [Paenibacillus dokdonensis]
MNRIYLIAGSIFLLSGTILLGLVYVAIANYVPSMTGWVDPPGKFSMALSAVMARTPYVISICFMIVGTILVIIPLMNQLIKDITAVENKSQQKHSDNQ